LEKRETKSVSTRPDARSGVDRRRYTYAAYVPDRRSGRDRRAAGARAGGGNGHGPVSDGRVDEKGRE